VWLGDRLSFFAQSIEVERNCLSHVMFHFFTGPASPKHILGDLESRQKSLSLSAR
jgi:hypothetical protein